jgi:predicted PurR-regulated permease PerM
MSNISKVIVPGAAPETSEPRKGSIRDTISIIGFSQIGLFVLAAVYAIYHSKPVLLPLVLALLMTMVLNPVHALLRRAGLPSVPASALVVICFLAGLAAASVRLADPATEWLNTIDMETAQVRFREVFAPIQKAQHELEEVVRTVDKMTNGDQPRSSEESGSADGSATRGNGDGRAGSGAQRVPDAEGGADASLSADSDARDASAGGLLSANTDLAVQIAAGNGGDLEVSSEDDGSIEVETDARPISVSITDEPVNVVYEYIQEFGIHAAATIMLVFFFLGFGDAMERRMSEDRDTAGLVDGVSRDVSWYLFTISAINAGLGICIGILMWIFGMPNAVLWGLMAAVLNYIPYLGAVVGTAIVFVVAMVSLDSVAMSFVAPAVYFTLTAIEGNFVTPTIIGRRFTLNPIVVVVWFMSWGALWGIPGMLIATPTLAAFKILCAKVEPLGRIDRIISV